jgi:amino acid adenylation domain-containing protein
VFEGTITEQLVTAARAWPEAIAVRQWDRELTYAEVMDRATLLAARLGEAEGDAGGLVGICAERTPELIVGVLGILLSGRGYVPLDPAHPPARLAEYARQARLTTIVRDRDIPTSAPRAEWHPGPATPDSIAYVYFTSGSTGRPKGVRVTHRNVTAFCAGCVDLLGPGPGDRNLGLTSIGFDAVVVDMFVTLGIGATLCLVPHADRIDPGRLNRFAQAHEVTFGVTTPQVLALLDPDAIPTLHTLCTGGEALTPAGARPWAKRRLLNVYGPTETTVFVLAADLSALDYDGDPPLGTPVGAHRAYVVDEGLRPVPDGTPGELLIAGPGVALGYLDDAELTARRFVPDPMVAGETCYRTGDVVTCDPGGQLHFLGRVDAQVKIRGQRVEPDEVAVVLRRHPAVRDAVVEALPDATGALMLVAFVATDTPGDELARRVREFLVELLTDAMVPTRFVCMTALPIALTGKVDRLALRAMVAASDEESTSDDPVAAAWARVLGGVPEPEDDFFAMGGHSIAAMRLVADLRTRLRRDIAVEDVFAGRTFAGLAARIEAAPALSGSEISFGHPPTLSPSQRRLWFLDQLAPDSAAYNVVFAERLRGELDVEALRTALRTVVDRHEVLRWRIRERDGVPYAIAAEPSDVDMPVVEVNEAGLAGALARQAGEPFDLATGPVWRAALFRLGPGEHVLCLVFHHAVADGWSQAPLYAELGAGYADRPLPSLPATYADYAAWRAARDAERAATDEAWWKAHLAGAPTVVDLPRDHHRPPVQTYAGAGASLPLSAGADAAVRATAAAAGATPSVVVLAAIGEALARWTGQDDNVIGAVLADRRRAEFDGLIGFLVDIVPLRLRAAVGTFAERVRECLEELLAVQAHPGIALERIVEAAGIRRDPARAPLVQVLFNVFNFAQPTLELSGLETERVPVDMPGSPFDITFYLIEREGRLGFDVVYNPDLYTAARVERMLGDLVGLLEALCAVPQASVREVGPRFDSVGVIDPVAPLAPGPVRAVMGPQTPTEATLISVWREVLGRAEVSAADNFFDLGGTSLALAEVRARLRERMAREVAMVDLFRYPNVRALASYLDGRAGAGSDELERAAQRAALRRSRAANRRGPTSEGER